MTELQQHRPLSAATANHRRTALVALGGNLPGTWGDPADAVAHAMAEVAALAPILARSRLYRTPAFPVGSGPDYVNAAVACRWDGSSLDLLKGLHEIEARMGRARRDRWGPRVVDLDLIGRGDEVAPDHETQAVWRELDPDAAAQHWPDRLILPHPRLQERAFVLVPLVEIAPDWRHPALGLTAAQLQDDLPPQQLAGIAAIT